MAQYFVLPLMMWGCGLPLLDVVLLRSCGSACVPMWCDGGWYASSEPSGHGDFAWVEVPCGEGADEGGKVGPAHWEVAGEGLAEAIIELSLNKSNESGRHVLLYRLLFSEA